MLHPSSAGSTRGSIFFRTRITRMDCRVKLGNDICPTVNGTHSGWSRTDFQVSASIQKRAGRVSRSGPPVRHRGASLATSLPAAATPSPMTPAAAPSPMAVEPAEGMAEAAPSPMAAVAAPSPMAAAAAPSPMAPLDRCDVIGRRPGVADNGGAIGRQGRRT